MRHLRSSRHRYRGFVEDYKARRLDEAAEAEKNGKPREDDAETDEAAGAESKPEGRGKRREYLREYLRWLWPHRWAVATVFFLALLAAGLQMVEPLFMRFIIDQVLLNTELDTAERLPLLNIAGGVFLGVIVLSSLINVTKDYRQRLLNTRVMLSLRRALYERLLHLPLPKLWDMKTG